MYVLPPVTPKVTELCVPQKSSLQARALPAVGQLEPG